MNVGNRGSEDSGHAAPGSSAEHGGGSTGPPDAAKLGRELIRIAGFLHVLFSSGLGKPELTLRQSEALDIVASTPGIRLGDLADHLKLAPSTVSALVNRMVRDDLLQRNANPENRREIQITLGKTGVRYLKNRSRVVEENLAGLLAILSAKDRERLTFAIETLADIIGSGGRHEA